MIRLFRVFIPTSVVGLLISEILLAYACYLAAIFWMEEISTPIYLLYETGLFRVTLVVASILLGLYFNDLYTNVRVLSRTLLVQQFCLAVGLAFITQALLSYVLPELVLERWNMILGSTLALVALPAWRMAYAHLTLKLMGTQKVLFLGQSETIERVSERLKQRPEFGLETMGYLGEPGAGIGECLGRVDQVKEVYQQRKPDLIAVGLEERRGRMPVQLLLELRLGGVRIEDASSLFEVVMGRVSLRSLRPSHLIFTTELGPNVRHVALQRLYSMMVALVGLVAASPLMLLALALVKLSSKGPAIYRQRRVGLHGRVFELYKFRSMYVDAEARTGAVWAAENDPRITPAGRWLRKLRLDELPQFVNVLKGEMAIVGPRPERPEFVEVLCEKIPFYGQRHAILPGITGWAQINHHYGATLEDTEAKLEYDLYYLKNMSFSLDAYIIFQTLKVMLLSRGSQ